VLSKDLAISQELFKFINFVFVVRAKMPKNGMRGQKKVRAQRPHPGSKPHAHGPPTHRTPP
jgi:hypothetical protein